MMRLRFRRRLLASFLLLLLLIVCLPACSRDTTAQAPTVGGFVIKFVGDSSPGTPEKPLLFSADEREFTLDIEARTTADAQKIETGFSGYAVIEVVPNGKLNQSPRAVKFSKGRATGVKVRLRLAFGEVRLTVTDYGYTPRLTDPAAAACNNGRDDDGDGYIDSPKDRGCYRINDETEGGGSNAAGVSPPIYITNPKLGDTQRPLSIDQGGNESALVGERVTIEGGAMLITRISVDGMYITDFEGARHNGDGFDVAPDEVAFKHMFAFNFSTPLNLQEGDCLVQIDGTVEEFFGFTELGKPIWKKGDYAFCSPLLRAMGVPESSCPVDATPDQELGCRREALKLVNKPVDMTKLMVTEDGRDTSVWDGQKLHAERYESGFVQLSDVKVFSEFRECDRNGNKVIDFSDPDERTCNNDCGDDPKCVVAETFRQYNQWTVHFNDGAGKEREVAIVSAGAMPDFDPLTVRGQTIKRVAGTLRHLVFARPEWILEPRRSADCDGCVADNP